jgi:hypothetical protein
LRCNRARFESNSAQDSMILWIQKEPLRNTQMQNATTALIAPTARHSLKILILSIVVGLFLFFTLFFATYVLFQFR